LNISASSGFGCGYCRTGRRGEERGKRKEERGDYQSKYEVEVDKGVELWRLEIQITPSLDGRGTQGEGGRISPSPRLPIKVFDNGRLPLPPGERRSQEAIHRT